MRILISALFAIALSNYAIAEEITACDVEAAHPSDPNHVGPGKETANVDTFAGIAACRYAVKNSPETARFHYQLGRSLVYQGEMEEGTLHVKHAADMNYVQAQFVLGLLSKGKDMCQAESLIKAAADQGLKSARITYVSDFLGGSLGDCTPSASIKEMSAYLEEARLQMSDYYENMLLNSLMRELKKHQ